MAERSGDNAHGSSLKASLESAERIVSAYLSDMLAGDDTAYAAYCAATAALEVVQRQQGHVDEQDDNREQPPAAAETETPTFCNCRRSCRGRSCACIRGAYLCSIRCKRGVHHGCDNQGGLLSAFPRRRPALERGIADQAKVGDEAAPPSASQPRPDVGSVRTPAWRVEKSHPQRMSMSSLLRQVARGKAAQEELEARRSEQISDQSEQVRDELGTTVYPRTEEENTPSAAPQAPPPA